MRIQLYHNTGPHSAMSKMRKYYPVTRKLVIIKSLLTQPLGSLGFHNADGDGNV